MAIKLNDLVRGVLDSACFGFVGTIDESNHPVITRVFGFRFNESQATFTVYTFQKDFQGIVESLTELTRVSATISNALDFKTVQFKGTYLDHYKTPESEMIYVKECNSKQKEIMKMLGIPNEVFANWNYSPSMAIIMNVEEIFDQTPKINSGNKIS